MEFQAFLSWFSLISLLPDDPQERRKADGAGFCRLGAIAQVAAELIEGATMLC